MIRTPSINVGFCYDKKKRKKEIRVQITNCNWGRGSIEVARLCRKQILDPARSNFSIHWKALRNDRKDLHGMWSHISQERHLRRKAERTDQKWGLLWDSLPSRLMPQVRELWNHIFNQYTRWVWYSHLGDMVFEICLVLVLYDSQNTST